MREAEEAEGEEEDGGSLRQGKLADEGREVREECQFRVREEGKKEANDNEPINPARLSPPQIQRHRRHKQRDLHPRINQHGSRRINRKVPHCRHAYQGSEGERNGLAGGGEED